MASLQVSRGKIPRTLSRTGEEWGRIAVGLAVSALRGDAVIGS